MKPRGRTFLIDPVRPVRPVRPVGRVALWLILGLCVLSPPTPAASPGDEVVIVYNKRLPASKELAQYYARKRDVPPKQMFGLDLSTNEEISRIEFRRSLQQPLADALESSKLWHVASRSYPATTNRAAHVGFAVVQSKIRYAVLCYGVPVKISPEPDLKERGVETLRPEMRRNEAAVDSELALLPLLEQHLQMAGPWPNPAFGVTNSALLHPTNGILLVARLDGPGADIARGLLDKALAAEENGLWGRAYFDLRNITEPGYKMGDDWLRAAAQIARGTGFETVVDENGATFPPGFPMSQIAIYMGWYSEVICGPFAQPTVEFMPGAIAYHLHSFSAASIRGTNHWVGPLLSKGATATMGCVYEPYLAFTPELNIFLGLLSFKSFTFGEAACASQRALSWQITVIGDPLYRPFGKNPKELHEELILRQATNSLAWSFLRAINIDLANGRPAADCAVLLEQSDLRKHSAVLAEKLGDLYAAQGELPAAIQTWEQALNLDASPQQQIRLLLELGNKLTGLDRPRDAYEKYEDLLRKFPDYPDKVALYQKLLPLARKLDKKEDAARFAALLQPPAPEPKQGQSGSK